MTIGTYISIITLNVNGLNAPTKRYRLAEWIQKQDLYICCLQDIYFRPKGTYRQNIYGSCFYIHLARMCPLVGAFNPLTFKVIIDIYVPIAIF